MHEDAVIDVRVEDGMRTRWQWWRRGGVSLLVAALMVLGVGSPASAAQRFTDVSPSVQFYPEIQWMAHEGISTGWVEADGSATYRPVQPVARDAMAAFLFRLAGQTDFTAPEMPTFTDVPVGTQFYREIEWLAARGISTGWTVPGGREFRPLQPIARDAMAAFLYRLAGSPDFTAEPWQAFDDVPAGHPYERAMLWMSVARISTGWYENDRVLYRPYWSVNRDAMAAFMYRFTEHSDPLPTRFGTMPAGFAFVEVTRQAEGLDPLAVCGPQAVMRYEGLTEASAWSLVEHGGAYGDEGEEHYRAQAALVFPDVARARAYLASVREASTVCLAGGGWFAQLRGTNAAPTHSAWDEAVATFTALKDESYGPWGTESLVARHGRSVVHTFFTGAYADYQPSLSADAIAEVEELLALLPA